MREQLKYIIFEYLENSDTKKNSLILKKFYSYINLGNSNSNSNSTELSQLLPYSITAYRNNLHQNPRNASLREKTNNLVEALINNGVSPDTNISGVSPQWNRKEYTSLLQLIVQRDPDNLPMVNFLLKAGASAAQFSSTTGQMLLDSACCQTYRDILTKHGARKYNGLKVLIPAHDKSDFSIRLKSAYEKLGADVKYLFFQDKKWDSKLLEEAVKGIDLLAIPGEAQELAPQETELSYFYKTLILKCLSRNIPVDGECAGNQRFVQVMSRRKDFRSPVDGHSGKFPRRGSERIPHIHSVTVPKHTGLYQIIKNTQLLTDSDHKKRINIKDSDKFVQQEASIIEKDGSKTVESISTNDSISTAYPIGRTTQFHPSAAMNISHNADIKTNRLDAAHYRKSHKEKYASVLSSIRVR